MGQKPFGIGFFAVVAVANTVTVRSNQYRISFDVAKLVEQGDTNAVVVTEDPEHPQPGFEVVLTDLIGTQDREAIIFPKGFKFAPDRADAMPVYKVCATLQEAQAVAAAKTAHAAIVGEPVKYVAFDPEEVMELNIIRYEQVHGRSWRSTEEYLRWSSGADNWADEPYSGEAPGQSVERLEALYSTDEGDDDGLPF